MSSSPPPQSQIPASPPPAHWVIVDTDAGVDDAVALCMLLKLQSSHNFKVKAITCSFGNTSLSNVIVNVGRCIDAAKRDDPSIDTNICFVGAAKGFNGQDEDASYFHGKDGLGDVDDIAHPETSASTEFGGDAIAKICDLADEAKVENARITIVTLGPLTNLALAMRRDPDLHSKIDKLVVMGGCGNGRGNVTRVAEFNVYSDVASSAIVFSEWTASRVIVVSWDLCVDFTLLWCDYDTHIGDKTDTDGHVASFLSKVCKCVYGNTRGDTKRSVKGAVICDAVAAAIVCSSSVVLSSEMAHVEIDISEGITHGMTVVDWGSCYDGVDRVKNVEWVKTIDVQLYSNLLKQTVENNKS